MSKINCPFHQDDTASLEVYEDGFYCFGCAERGTLDELKAAGVQGITSVAKDPPEDLNKSISHIKTMPKRLIRNLQLHYDDFGYYILWPFDEYYKKRLWDPRPGQPKYYCPRGHKQPLFFIEQPRHCKTLYFVEGEINALSIAEAIPDADVCSPGGASQFTKDHLRIFEAYDNIVIIADNDKAGVMAYIELQTQLSKIGRVADRILMKEDANEILVQHGKEELKKRITEQRR